MKKEFFPIGTPDMLPKASAWLIREVKAFGQRINKYGESGSLYLSHLVGIKEVCGAPLIKRE